MILLEIIKLCRQLQIQSLYVYRFRILMQAKKREREREWNIYILLPSWMQRYERKESSYLHIKLVAKVGTKLGAKCTLRTVRISVRVPHMYMCVSGQRIQCEEVNQADQASQHPRPVRLFKVCLTLSTMKKKSSFMVKSPVLELVIRVVPDRKSKLHFLHLCKNWDCMFQFSI